MTEQQVTVSLTTDKAAGTVSILIDGQPVVTVANGEFSKLLSGTCNYVTGTASKRE